MPQQVSCLIVLGAHHFPLSPDLGDYDAIRHSAQELRAYFLKTPELNLSRDYVLDLFGSPLNPSDQLSAISAHLEKFIEQTDDKGANQGPVE